MRKHSVSIRGHATSFSLEDAFWDEIQNIAKIRKISLARLIAQIDESREPDENLSSALRLCVLQHLKQTKTVDEQQT
ncbi:MAG: ribbon-helix-helix domain-containing protein [Pseudomonadota bacterium]